MSPPDSYHKFYLLGSLGRRKKEVILAKDSLTAVSFRNGLQQQLGVKQLGKHYRHGNPSHAVLVQAFIWYGLWLNSWFLKFLFDKHVEMLFNIS